MTKAQKMKKESWRFAAGRIRALEAQLFSTQATTQLFAATSEEEVLRMMHEHGYSGTQPAAAMQEMLEQTARVVQDVSPDDRYFKVLLLFQDAVNLKALLKNNTLGWLKLDEQMKEPDATYRETLEPLIVSPANKSIPELTRIILERQSLDCQKDWLADVAQEALLAYEHSYDISRIDLVVDRMVHERTKLLAEQLGNRWLIDYLSLYRDFRNLETLLRCRSLKLGATYFEQSLLPEGELSHAELLAWRELDDAELRQALEFGRFADVAALVEGYALPGGAARFGQLMDQKLMAHIRLAQRTLSGPEVPLAYFLARQMEMKNIRIVLTGLANQFSAERLNGLARPAYLNWGNV